MLAAALRTHLQRHLQMGLDHYPLTPSLQGFLQAGLLPPETMRQRLSAREKQAPERHRQTLSTPVAAQSKPLDRLSDLHRDIASCGTCAVAADRTGHVLGQGGMASGLLVVGDYCRRPAQTEVDADLLFGAEEDELLWKMMQAIGLDRGSVYVTNVCKCIPATGQLDEGFCEPGCQTFFNREIALVQPRLILAMGEIAARTVLGRKGAVLRLRGRMHPSSYPRVGGGTIPVIVSLHPRYLLAQPAMKRAAWQDLQGVRQHLQRLLENGPQHRDG
jgi:DNA polymerase